MHNVSKRELHSHVTFNVCLTIYPSVFRKAIVLKELDNIM
jgi:hypothetical protein